MGYNKYDDEPEDVGCFKIILAFVIVIILSIGVVKCDKKMSNPYSNPFDYVYGV